MLGTKTRPIVKFLIQAAVVTLAAGARMRVTFRLSMTPPAVIVAATYASAAAAQPVAMHAADGARPPLTAFAGRA